MYYLRAFTLSLFFQFRLLGATFIYRFVWHFTAIIVRKKHGYVYYEVAPRVAFLKKGNQGTLCYDLLTKTA